MNPFDFSISHLPEIIFSRGAIKQLPALCLQYGRQVLLVTGAKSFVDSDRFPELKKAFSESAIEFQQCIIPGEPSPDMIDEIVKQFQHQSFDVVLGVGGGSALDAAKAIAGLLKVKKSVMDYLEGVGPELEYVGPAVPFIAVPTTAGTGSEATKNAVLSVQGNNGFKKSFRDNKLMAKVAVIDPELLSTCPKNIIAANGMDALTQLIESYVSTRANPLTDALALSGIAAAKDSLVTLYENNKYSVADVVEAQNKMAYASLLSGICLAQTGLGSVHGLASPLGAFYPIPHGVVCGTLMAQATRMNIQLMEKREVKNIALDKYAHLGNVMTNKCFDNKSESRHALCLLLDDYTKKLNLPKLSSFGLTEPDLDNVVLNSRGSSMKTNPIVMTDAEIRQLLVSRL